MPIEGVNRSVTRHNVSIGWKIGRECRQCFREAGSADRDDAQDVRTPVRIPERRSVARVPVGVLRETSTPNGESAP